MSLGLVFDVRVIAALWDDERSVRIIEVWENDTRIETYETRLAR